MANPTRLSFDTTSVQHQAIPHTSVFNTTHFHEQVIPENSTLTMCEKIEFVSSPQQTIVISTTGLRAKGKKYD